MFNIRLSSFDDSDGSTEQDRAFLRAKWILFKRRWKGLSLEGVLQISGFAILLCVFWSLSFFLVSYLCSEIQRISVVGPIVLQRVLSFGFFAAFVVVAVGHILSAFSSLFRGSKLPVVVSSPYSMRRLYRYQAMETLLTGSWVSGIFCLPILWAYGNQLGASWWYYPVVLLGLIGLLAIAGLCGILVMLLIARFVIGRPVRTLIGMILVLAVFSGLIVYISQAGKIFFAHVQMKEIGEALANLRMSSTPYMPNNWLAELMVAARTQDLFRVFLYLTLFFSGTMFLWNFTLELGEYLYPKAWLWAQEQVTLGKRLSNDEKLKPRKLWVQRLLPQRTGAIIYKEIHLFLRDFSQWGQLVLILTLILFYVSHMRGIRMIQESEVERNQIAFFNVILIGFLQATLALRYTFPSISLEGKASWALFSSSTGILHYYYTKFFFHSLLLLVFGLTIVGALNTILDIDPTLHILCLMILVLMSFGLAACTLGLGAIFHNFEAKTAADVTSDTGALVAMILTLLYFAFSMYLSARFTLNFYLGKSFFAQFSLQEIQNPMLYLEIAAFLALQYIVITLPTSLGMRKLQDYQF